MNDLQLFTPSFGLAGYHETPAVNRLTVAVSRNAPDTSIDAAVKARPKSGKQREAVYNAIKAADGATSDELSQTLGLPAQSITARVNSLANDGLIYDTGLRRLTRYNRKAIVWGPSHGL